MHCFDPVFLPKLKANGYHAVEKFTKVTHSSHSITLQILCLLCIACRYIFHGIPAFSSTFVITLGHDDNDLPLVTFSSCANTSKEKEGNGILQLVPIYLVLFVSSP